MERYEKIMSISQSLLQENCPVIFEKGALLKDNKLNKNILQLQFKNIGLKTCKAVYISINCLDVEKKYIETVEKKYLDLELAYNKTFGENIPIELSSDLSRKYEFIIKKIIFTDDSICEYSKKALTFERPYKLEVLGELKDQFIREVEKECIATKCKVKPTVIVGFWYCTCGALNHSENDKCGACGIAKEKLFHLLNYDYLIKQKAEYQKQKEIEENERKLQEAQRTEELRLQEEIRKEKRKKIKKIAVIVAIIVILLCAIYSLLTMIVVPATKYSSALQAIENGKYEEGYQLLTELGDYKDSAEQILEGKYKQALELFDMGEYLLAANMYSELGDYKDCVEQMKEAKYLQGKKYLEDNEIEKAVTILTEIKNYKDSENLCLETEYGYICSMIEISPQIAIDYFENEGKNFSSAKQNLLKAKYYSMVLDYEITAESFKIYYDYLNELIENNYEGAKEMYDSRFPKTFIVANYDKDDIYTEYRDLTISKNQDIYFHIVSFGEPISDVEVRFEDLNTNVYTTKPLGNGVDVTGTGVYVETFVMSESFLEGKFWDLNLILISDAGTYRDARNFDIVKNN